MFDHPSSLCRRLAAGKLGLALVSSFEFLRNPVYSIVDGVAICSDGPVYSVFVAHHPDEAAHEIELDPASTTGASLMRCLLAERGESWREHPAPTDALTELSPNRTRLLIGDQAIRFRRKFDDRYRYLDLGEEWQRRTKLPFVFALWLVRPEVTDASRIAAKLRQLKDVNLAGLDDLIREEKEFSPDFLRFYYETALRFDLGAQEKEGLRLFWELCIKHSLLRAPAGELRVV